AQHGGRRGPGLLSYRKERSLGAMKGKPPHHRKIVNARFLARFREPVILSEAKNLLFTLET
ncbi:MAG: hypothetical protein ACRD1J_00515, partial [Terriglobia bacterium]